MGSQQGVASRLGVERGASNSSPQKITMLQTIQKFFRLGLIVWYDVSMEKGHEIWHMEHGEPVQVRVT